MADDPINQPRGNNEIYYNGIPTFQPPPIVGNPTAGTTGAPPAAPTSITVPVAYSVPIAPEITKLQALEAQFAQVGLLFDQKGSSMNICQNLPPEIAVRYLQEVRPGETCWQFYKRMIAVVQTITPPNTATLTTTGQQLTVNGNNTIATQAATNPGTLPNYNDNPGGPTLQYMLFVAIIVPIANLILDAVYPIGLQFATQLGSIITVFGIPVTPAVTDLAYTIAFQAVKQPFLDLVQQIVNAGPTLSENVTNYNALIITNHMQQTAQYSTALNWPEAAMMYSQYSALTGQITAMNAAYSYFTQGYTGQSRATINTQLGAGAAMPADMAQLMQLHQSQASGMLNNMAAVLTQDITDTLICCLIRLLGSQSPRWLQTVMALLQLTINRQAQQFTSLDAGLNNIWAQIEKVIMYEVLAQIYNLFDELNNTIKSDLNAVIQSPFFQSGACPPWNLFSQNMLQFIGGTELSILELATSLMHSLQAQTESNNNYTATMNTNIYARQLINLIQTIQNAQQLGSICQTSSVPTDAELQLLFDQLKTQFIPIVTSSNPTSPGSPTGTSTTNVNSTAQAALMNQFDKCLAQVPQAQVEEMMAWIAQLTGQTNG